MNQLRGKIASVEAQGSVALVDVIVSAHSLTSIVLGASDAVAQWRAGMPVTLAFKETEVSLAKQLSGQISLRNRMPCVVKSLTVGKILTEVELQMDGETIRAIITSRSARSLQLAVGDQVEALVKANEMAVIVADR